MGIHDIRHVGLDGKKVPYGTEFSPWGTQKKEKLNYERCINQTLI